MAKKPRENRIPIMMSDEELTSIDDWRFANRVATRSEAIRRLCQLGLAMDGVVSPITKYLLELSQKYPNPNDVPLKDREEFTMVTIVNIMELVKNELFYKNTPIETILEEVVKNISKAAVK